MRKKVVSPAHRRAAGLCSQRVACPQCQRRHRTRSAVVNVLHKVLFTTLMLLFFLTVPLIVFLFAMPFITPEGTWLMLTGSLVGVGLLALVVWSFETCRRSVIPYSLRQIGRFPFFFLLYALTPNLNRRDQRAFMLQCAG